MFSIDTSVILIIDVQGNLAHSMVNKDTLFKNIQNLIKLAGILEIPVLYTEQAPHKIGATIPEIKEFLSDKSPIIKESFSCCGCEQFLRELESSNRREVIVAGIEAHVCIYQTVADLIKLGFQTQIVVDAISSRLQKSTDIALNRMKLLGAMPTGVEMLATELLRTSKHEKFKAVLELIK